MAHDERSEALIRRVRKLLDKAERTVNPHESDAFAAKAARLVAEHRIDPAQLSERRQAGDDLVVRDITLGRGAYVRARLALLTGIADANDVRVLFRSTPVGTVAHAVGFSSDVDVVEVMYHSLHQQAAAQMTAIRRATGAATQRYRRSFLFGYADRIGEILADTRAAAEAQVPVDAAGETSIVLRDRIDRVEEFVSSSFGRTRTARPAGAAQPSGWYAGASAAERADVGRTRLAGRAAIGAGGG